MPMHNAAYISSPGGILIPAFPVWGQLLCGYESEKTLTIFQKVQDYTELYGTIKNYTELYRAIKGYTEFYRGVLRTKSCEALFGTIRNYVGLYRTL